MSKNKDKREIVPVVPMSEEHLNQLIELETSNVIGTESDERKYGRMFKTLFQKVRKTLLVLSKNRKAIGSKVAYDKAIEQIQKFAPELVLREME